LRILSQKCAALTKNSAYQNRRSNKKRLIKSSNNEPYIMDRGIVKIGAFLIGGNWHQLKAYDKGVRRRNGYHFFGNGFNGFVGEQIRCIKCLKG
jgi:hypothetical protein